jgi:probable phosphomutase (TIGR03848 family)
MTTFLLIRHGAHLLGGDRIAGRMPDVHLSPLGQQQAERLAERLRELPVRALYCSPVDRARETAAPLAQALGLPVRISEPLAEIDYGDWTGQRLDDLRALDLWRQWNAFRSGTRVPNGESMAEVQARIVGEIERLRVEHPGELLALVSHGDVIKSALAHLLGISLDLFLRLEIGLASVSVVQVAEYGPWVLCVNSMDGIPLPY